MAFKKSSEEPVTEEQGPVIDQESMTEAVADVRRDGLDKETDSAPKNVVLYTGLVSERRISTDEWEQAGVSGQDGVVWTRGTGNTIPIDHFSEEALQVLAHSGEFQIIRDE